MKKIIIFAFIVFLFAVISSCGLWESKEIGTAAIRELDQLRTVLLGLESAFSLVPDITEEEGSRGLAPEKIPDFMNGDVAKTPAEIYTQLGGSGGRVRYPSGNARIKDYINAGHEMYLTLEPVSGSFYRVKMYVYPTADFLVDYSYYEYNVDSDAGLSDYPWQVLNGENEKGQYISKRTYYCDGTYAEETIVRSSSTQTYATFDVPTVNGTTIGLEYRYPSGITEPERSGGSGYSAHTRTSLIVKGSTLSGEIFYTEQGNLYSSLSYFVLGNKKTVGRSLSNETTGKYDYRSFTVEGNQWSQWFSEINIIDISLSGGFKNYISRNLIWYADNISGNPGQDILIEIKEQDRNAQGLFTGTIKKSWNGSSWNVYTYTVTILNNGYKYREKWSGTEPYTPYLPENYSVSRGIENNTAGEPVLEEVEIIFSGLSGLSVALPTGNFTGDFIQSGWIGTFTDKKGRTFGVEIYRNTLLVEGQPVS